MGAGVFVSYRRDDDPGWAGRVRDALAGHFGEDAVFFDRDSIRGGDRWEAALDEALDACSALVLVVGPRWITCLQERQQRDEPDFHLREITRALERGVVVYPVRVQGAAMPDLADLPEALRDRLPALQWSAIHDDLFRPSMDRVIGDLERTAGVRAAAPAAWSDPALAGEVVVGPWDSDATVAEIADAVARVAPGGRIRVLPGRYLKPVVLDRPVSIVGAGRGEVVLDPDASPAIRSTVAGVVVRRLAVRVRSEPGARGIEVVDGDLTVDDVAVEAKRPAGTTGIVVEGPSARLVLLGSEIGPVDVGLVAEASAEVRCERTSVRSAGSAAVRSSGGATIRLLACSIVGAADDGGGVVVADGGGSLVVEESSIVTGAQPAVAVGEGRLVLRGALPAGPPGSGGPAGSAAGRVARAVPGVGAARPVVEGERGAAWHVHLAEGATGVVTDAELAAVVVRGGEVRFEGCAIGAVELAGPATSVFVDGAIGRAEIGDGAAPVFRATTFAPDRGVKVTVDVLPGARATFEGCEIAGRNVRDGSPDPALRVVGGSAQLEGCTVRNPGEGAVWAEAGGTVRLAGGEVRSTVSGAAVVVVDGHVSAAGTTVGGGIRAEGGAVVAEGGSLVGDAVSGRVVQASGAARVELVDVAVTGPGLARTRKVGRWIESRSEKVAGATSKLLGTEPVLVGAPASLRLERCTLAGLDPEHLGAIEGVGLIGCAEAGSPEG